MRNPLLLAALSLAVTATHAAAQTPLQLGFTGGAVIATLVGDDAENPDSRTSPFFGGTLVVHPTGSLLGFETGLLYVPKGASNRFDGGRGTLKLTYMEVPALLRIGLTLAGSDIRPVLAVGGSLGFNTACRLEGRAGTVTIDVACDDSILGGQFDVKSVDFGLSAGLSADIPMGHRTIIAPSVRYTRGLTNIADTADNADLKNSAVQLGASVRFRL